MRIRMGVDLVSLGVLSVVGACSNHVAITPDQGGETSGSTTGAPGGGSGGAASTSVASAGSTGTGGPEPAVAKMVTAETDIDQYVSRQLPSSLTTTPRKMIEGPFFLTDLHLSVQSTGAEVFTVSGGDCDIPPDDWQRVATVVHESSSAGVQLNQLHGMRLAVLAGQTLCAATSASLTYVGFRPY